MPGQSVPRELRLEFEVLPLFQLIARARLTSRTGSRIQLVVHPIEVPATELLGRLHRLRVSAPIRSLRAGIKGTFSQHVLANVTLIARGGGLTQALEAVSEICSALVSPGT